MKRNNIFKQESRLVGGIVPQPLANKLSLYCLHSKRTRSKVIANLLEKELSLYDEKEMIKEIGKQLSKKIEGLVTSKKVAFLSKARDELRRKKIDSKHTDQILTIARHLCAKNKVKEKHS